MSRKYTKEFKESIVKMMKDGADAHDLSQEYGPHYQTILKLLLRQILALFLLELTSDPNTFIIKPMNILFYPED